MSNKVSLKKENETLKIENHQLQSKIVQLEKCISECSERQCEINNWMNIRLSEIDIKMRDIDEFTEMIYDMLDEILSQTNIYETITIVDTTNGSTPSKHSLSTGRLAQYNTINSINSVKSSPEESSPDLDNSEEDSPELARNKSFKYKSPDDPLWTSTVNTKLERSPIKTRSGAIKSGQSTAKLSETTQLIHQQSKEGEREVKVKQTKTPNRITRRRR